MKKTLTIAATLTLFILAAMAKDFIIELKSGEQVRLRVDDIEEVRFDADLAEVELPADPYPSATDFAHRNLIMDHTGTKCVHCPLMVMALDELAADPEYAGKFTLAAVHSYDGDPMGNALTQEISKVYMNGSGYPYANVNLKKTGHGATSNYRAIADRLRETLSAENAAITPSGISSAAHLQGNTLKLTLSAKAAVDGKYRIGAMLLENGITARQDNSHTDVTGDRDFNTHNNVVRAIIGRDTDGEFSGINLGTLKAGQSEWTNQTIELEKGWKAENCRLLIYVSQLIDGKYVCVNSAYAPIDGEYAFEYSSDKPGTDTYVTLSRQLVNADANGGDYNVPFSLAIGSEIEKISLSTNVDWIKDLKITGLKISFTADINESDVTRSGRITVTYGDCRPIDISVQQQAPGSSQEDYFIIETQVISPYSASVTYNPNGYEGGYVHLVAKASVIDAYIEAGNIQGWIDGDIAWLHDVADANGLTFEELLSIYKQAYSTGGGEPVTVTYRDLENNTDYYAYCYGLTTDGRVTTEFYKQKFTTSIVSGVDLSLSASISDIGTDSAKVVVTPSDNDVTYYWTYVTEMDMAKYDLNEIMDNMIQNIKYAISTGADIYDIIHMGPSAENMTNLWKGTKYYLVGWGMDEMGTPTTEPMQFGEFRTLSAQVSDNCTFKLDTPEIRDNDILLHIKPSKDNVRYYAAFVEESKCYGYNDEQMAQRLINMEKERFESGFYGSGASWDTVDWMLNGEQTKWGRKDLLWTFSPNHTYRIFVFGVDANGERNTEIAVIDRTTLAPPSSDMTVDIELTDATWDYGTFTFTPSNDEEYYIPLLVATEELKYITKEDGTLDEEMLCNEIEHYYDETPNYYTHSGKYTQQFRWTSDKDYTMLVCGWSGGNTTHFFRYDTHTPKLEFNGEGDVECKYELFDASELAEIDYNRWKDYRGYVVIRLQFTPNDKATYYCGGVWMPVATYEDNGGIDYLVTLDQNPDVSIVNRPTAMYRTLGYNTEYSLSYFAKDKEGRFGPWHYIEFTPKRGENIDEPYDFWSNPSQAPSYVVAVSPEGEMETISKPAGAPDLMQGRLDGAKTTRIDNKMNATESLGRN